MLSLISSAKETRFSTPFQGRLSDAKLHYEKALQLHPGDPLLVKNHRKLLQQLTSASSHKAQPPPRHQDDVSEKAPSVVNLTHGGGNPRGTSPQGLGDKQGDISPNIGVQGTVGLQSKP